MSDLHPNRKEVFLFGLFSAVIASLCCITPIVLVLLGISSITAAAALGSTLYFGYRWVFILVSLVTLSTSLFFYYRKKGVCTLDEYRRNKRQILNTIFLLIPVVILSYLIFNYVILEFIGYFLGIWGVPYLGLEVDLPPS